MVVAFVRTAKRVKDYILIVPTKSFGDRRRELLRFSDCELKLRLLGPARETDDQQRAFLICAGARASQ